MKMTEAEFQRIYRYVKLHYGIDMSKKKEIMTGRLENYVVVHGYASYDAFMNALETDPTGHMEKAPDWHAYDQSYIFYAGV